MIVSIAEKRHPPSNVLIGAEPRQIAEDPPIADACRRVDGPERHGQRENRRVLVLGQPEDHRRTLPRCRADRRPIALLWMVSRHGRLDFTGPVRRECVPIKEPPSRWYGGQPLRHTPEGKPADPRPVPTRFPTGAVCVGSCPRLSGFSE